MVIFTADQWRRIARAMLQAAGASEPNSTCVADALVNSSLAGHDSHGVIRIIQYIRSIEKGEIDPAARPEVMKETACTSLIDGNWTFGQVGAQACTMKAISQAKTSGIAISGLVRANHIGRLGEYAEMASAAGMIGIVLVSGFVSAGGAPNSGVAPYGGSRPAFGTNPISFGLPAGEMGPVIVDFATSAIAGGRISLARARGTQLPPGCILDKDGNPSTNPQDFYESGILLPFGGHKGYGLAVAIQLLGQALTGGDMFGAEAPRGGSYSRTGSTFIVIDPGIFRSLESYRASADANLRRIKSVPPAPGFTEVLIPGEPERRTRERRLLEGIPLPDSSWSDLQELAAKYRVDIAGLLD